MLDVISVIMQGDYTYCMKYGHDWSGRWELTEDGWLTVECAICGARQTTFEPERKQ